MLKNKMDMIRITLSSVFTLLAIVTAIILASFRITLDKYRPIHEQLKKIIGEETSNNEGTSAWINNMVGPGGFSFEAYNYEEIITIGLILLFTLFAILGIVTLLSKKIYQTWKNKKEK